MATIELIAVDKVGKALNERKFEKRGIACGRFGGPCRDLMRERKITLEEGKEARKLLNMPGGLELHIGVPPPSGLAMTKTPTLLYLQRHFMCRSPRASG